MKETRATRGLGTVFHKHKYISNPAVTPADAVIAAAGNLASLIKGKMPQHLQESPLSELTRLSAIFLKPRPRHRPRRQRRLTRQACTNHARCDDPHTWQRESPQTAGSLRARGHRLRSRGTHQSRRQGALAKRGPLSCRASLAMASERLSRWPLPTC